MTSGPEQQTARVNIDDDAWRRFRILALESDRTIADYLGQLVRDELRRSKKRKRRPVGGADAVSADTQGRATTSGRSRESIRLSEAELLTELPRPERSSGRSVQPA